jgi:signal transduction histidine kinase
VSLSSAPLSGAGQVTGAVVVFQNIMEVKRAEQQQRFLAEASAVLASSLEYRETLDAVARLAVPLLADLCMFDELYEDGTIERLVVVATDEDKRRLASQAVRAPQAGWKTPQAMAIESGDPTVIGDLPTWMEEVDDDGAEHVAVMRALGLKSILVFPMLARGRTLGALTLATAESDRRYSRADLAIAEDLARRAAIAIDNSRLAHAAQKEIRSRQDLLSIVSHDLQNPLSVIFINLDRMLTRTDLDERTTKQLGAMTRSAHRMHRMIRDLLDTASIEEHHLAIVRELVDVAPLIAMAVGGLQPQAANMIALVQEVGPDLPKIFADAARIEQVLVNLAGNAIKFTASGGTITVRAEAVDDAVRFSVRDTGSGIAVADLGRLFDRFYQAKETARRGTGLGLFIVRGIVEAHGGRIWVESQLGVGSTFFFTVPTAISQEPA